MQSELDPELKNYYRDKLRKEQVALTGLQLLQRALQQNRRSTAGSKRPLNRVALKKQIYTFLREEAAERGPSFARRDATRHYQGTVDFKAGVYFVDYGEFHKGWSGSNGGATGFLVAVENLTNRLFVLPTRGKGTKQWLESVAKFVESTRQVSVIYSDRDSVASSGFRRKILDQYGIRWHFLKKGHKSYLAERYVGFVKTKLSQVLESDQQLLSRKRWVDLVDPLVREYNQQQIEGTTYKRQAVSKENFSAFLSQLFKTKDYDLQITGRAINEFARSDWNSKVFAFKLGDRVRVSRKADWTDPNNRGGGFQKVSMVGGYGSKIYTISGRQLRATKDFARFVPVYKLAEVNDGGFNFYENELVRVKNAAAAAE